MGGDFLKRYPCYVNDVMKCMEPVVKIGNPCGDFLGLFAEGIAQGKIDRPSREYSVLLGEKAEFLTQIIRDASTVLGIDPQNYAVVRPNRPPELVKTALKVGNECRYAHGCYPKNLSRWRKGTLARKKKNRVEFAALATCWAAGWTVPMKTDEVYVTCRRELFWICRELVPCAQEPEELSALFLLLWQAGQAAYRMQ